MKINLNDIPEVKAGIYDASNKLSEVRTAETGRLMLTLQWQLDDGLDTTLWHNIVYAVMKEEKLVLSSVGARQIKSLLTVLEKVEDYSKGFDPEKDAVAIEDTNLRIKINVGMYQGRKQAQWEAYLPANAEAEEGKVPF